jgi:aminoglycoside 6-adenylyltransferase
MEISMINLNNEYERIIERLIEYGKSTCLVKAIILIGSQSRENLPSDEYSDIDMILFVTDIDFFINSDEWLHTLGKCHISFAENTVAGGMERRVFFDNGMDADFIFLQVDRINRFYDLAEIVARSYKILLDKENFTELIDDISNKANLFARPTEQEFQNLINAFWFHVIWSTKKAYRGELWSSITCVNGYMKELLLKAIEYYEHALHGDNYDTWHCARFIERWAEPEIVEKFKNIYATYSKDDVLKATFTTLELFRKVTVDTAAYWGYQYPYESDDYATKWFMQHK